MSFCYTLAGFKKINVIIYLSKRKEKLVMRLKESILWKKIEWKVLSYVASMAFFITTINVHTCCWFMLGQDKLPENAKKLSRF